jgi:hypothetical protein
VLVVARLQLTAAIAMHVMVAYALHSDPDADDDEPTGAKSIIIFVGSCKRCQEVSGSLYV